MAQQEGLERYKLKESYYDIMLVGMTGKGKSTTADKLLIANPEGKVFSLPETTQPQAQDDPRGSDRVKIALEDMSTWLLHQEDQDQDVETHLKGLLYCRASDDPHSKVNGMRDPAKDIYTEGTASCQVFSNDTTKIRILDVPGFNDGKAFKSPTKTSAEKSSANAVFQTAKDVTAFNLSITRNVIRIQAALGMCFRRIVYFLPSRGPLERADSLLKTELQSLETAFGRSIFECMVAVATLPRRYSLKKEPDEEKFPREDVEQCEKFFQESLREVLPLGPCDAEPKVPIVFISLSEACESILSKIKEAKVSCDSLIVSFNPSTCANCGIKIGSVSGERLTCSFSHDADSSIPYEESTCHPAFRRSFLRKLLGQTLSHSLAQRWPSYKEEYCIRCGERPFERGCMQVRREYKTWWGGKYVVDHTSEVSEPVMEPERDRDHASLPEHAELGATPSQDVRADQLVAKAGHMQISNP